MTEKSIDYVVFMNSFSKNEVLENDTENLAYAYMLGVRLDEVKPFIEVGLPDSEDFEKEYDSIYAMIEEVKYDYTDRL